MLPPPEPPVFEIPPAVYAMENEPIFIQIAATLAGTNDTEGLQIYLENVPENITFSVGTDMGSRWVLIPEEFGEVEVNVPEDYFGIINLEITAVVDGAMRRRNLVIDIQPNITATTMIATDAITTDAATTDATTDTITTDSTTDTIATDATTTTEDLTSVETDGTEIPSGTTDMTDAMTTNGTTSSGTTDRGMTDGTPEVKGTVMLFHS